MIMSHPGTIPAKNSSLDAMPQSTAVGVGARPLSAAACLLVVLAVWVLCWLANGWMLYRYSTPLPFCDEWYFTPVAAGNAPLTLAWLWHPVNEHRTPLANLDVLLLGWLADWDLRLARYVHVGFLALGSLALILSVRSFRGRTALSDAVLPLLVMTPCQYETVFLYAYGFAMALAYLCLALSAVITGWPLRSAAHVLLYFVLLLVIALSGGPAGNVWSIGLCGIVIRGWLEKKPRAWHWTALGGTAAVVACSLALLVLIPKVPRHQVFYSDSLQTTLRAAFRLIVGWMGGASFEVLYPWAGLALLLPIGYLARRILGDLRRLRLGRGSAAPRISSWVDLSLVLLAALAVAGMIAIKRAHYPIFWNCRYATLVVPIAIVAHLLMVRLRAPAIFTAALAVLAAVTVCWNWPVTIRTCRLRHSQTAALTWALKEGRMPLAIVAQTYGSAVNMAPCNTDFLDFMGQLREAHLSVFHPKWQQPGQSCRPVFWEAESGRFNEAFRRVPDAEASHRQALEAVAAPGHPAIARYNAQLTGAGSIMLWCRVRAPVAGQIVAAQFDDGPVQETVLPAEAGYVPYCLGPFVDVSAGHHTLTVSLPMPGARLDVLELVPCDTRMASK
jgi:hypothetical protein